MTTGLAAVPTAYGRRCAAYARARFAVCTAIFTLSLIGCAAVRPGQALYGVDSEKNLNGTVRGGQQPISGAAIQLYAVGTTGDGSPATPLLSQTVSTDGSGDFSLTGLYTCPSPTAQVYLTAVGGNPGLSGGGLNPRIALMSVLGDCGSLTPNTQISLNELTTVASANALAPFMQSVTNVGSGTADATALVAAFASALVLYDPATGTAPGQTAPPAGYTVPVATLNTLSDLLESCINSSGGVAGDGSACGNLFGLSTTVPGSAPTDTVLSALDIANRPTAHLTELFDLAAPVCSFVPGLIEPPLTWSLSPVLQVAAPVIVPGSGTFTVAQSVTIADGTGGAVIHYTLDGSTPTVASALYTGALPVTATTTIQAIAVVGTAVSPVASATVAIVPQLVFTASPTNGTVGASFTPTVQVAAEDHGGHILTGLTGQVTLALAANSFGATLTGTVTGPLVNGVASFANLSIATAGTGLSLTATSPGITSGTSAVFSIAAPPTLPLVAARSADSFVASVGLNVHFSYYGSIYTNQSAQMIADLGQLGVRHLRDQMAWEGTVVADSPFYAIHNQFGPMGIGTDYIMTSLTYPASRVGLYPSLVDDMEAAEPANEADASGDANWVADITAQQAALYNAVHGTNPIPGITVLAPSLAQPNLAPQLGNVSAISDAGNSHPYFSGWNPGNSGTGGANNPAYFLNLAHVNNPLQPIWVTETGYWSVPGPYSGGYGVDEATQAIYVPRTLLEFWNAGATRTYIYELVDWTSTSSFGLLRGDGTAKPAFPALTNLLTLLSDPGTNFTPGALAYQLKGTDAQVHQALFEKVDGSFYIALWVEAQSYDFTNQTAIVVPARSVTLQLGRTVLSATGYQWDGTGKMTPTTLTPSLAIPLTVTDKLQIVKLTLR